MIEALIRCVIVAAIASTSFSGCMVRKPDLILAKSSKQEAKLSYFPHRSESFGSAGVLPASLAVLISELSATADDETLWALSLCGCLPELKTEIFKNQATRKGVLPQILVPRVRGEIGKNKQLDLVLKLPGILSDVLKGIFANDGKIAETVRESLSTKIAKVVKGDLKANIPFTFDHYLLRTVEGGKTFQIKDMTARWNLVFSVENFWRDKPPMTFDHHGLQVLESIRTLSEWKYFLGLDKRPSGEHYGGLTFDTATPLSTELMSFNPRVEKDARRIVAGSYTLQPLDGKDAVDIALNARERWTRTASAPEIVEQAMFWNAAAIAFHRLRVDNRLPSSAALYAAPDDEASEALLPHEVHLLSLAFLSGMQVILQDQFLDKESRTVRDSAGGQEIKDLRVLARLGRALFSWINVINNPEKAGLSDEQVEKLLSAPEKLKDALRLVMLAMIKSGALENQSKYPLSDVAESISLLLDVEQTLLPSPHMRKIALEASHHFAKTWLETLWNGSSPDKPTAKDVLWIYMVATALNRYTPDVHQAPWLTPLLKQVQTPIGERGKFPWVL